VPDPPTVDESVWRFGFLGDLNPAQRDAVLRHGRSRTYKTNAVLFREGDRSTFAVAVLAGRLKVSCTSADGHETVLAFRGPGDLVGELSLFDGAERSATVSAVEPATVVVITADRFAELLHEQPDIGALLLRIVTSKLRDADRKRVEFGSYDTAGRVARRLVELADDHGLPGSGAKGGVRITLPLSQTELAGWTGASREAVARALALLRQRELITTDRRSIVVLDLAALRALAR
jgi:CRP/FNR family transcriptional regulator, cyclic AMP receptor protein